MRARCRSLNDGRGHRDGTCYRVRLRFRSDIAVNWPDRDQAQPFGQWPRVGCVRFVDPPANGLEGPKGVPRVAREGCPKGVTMAARPLTQTHTPCGEVPRSCIWASCWSILHNPPMPGTETYSKRRPRPRQRRPRTREPDAAARRAFVRRGLRPRRGPRTARHAPGAGARGGARASS